MFVDLASGLDILFRSVSLGSVLSTIGSKEKFFPKKVYTIYVLYLPILRTGTLSKIIKFYCINLNKDSK